jgi:GTP cyclohydrolase II
VDSIKKIAEADFPSRWGRFRIFGYEGLFTTSMAYAAANPVVADRRETAVALVMGDVYSQLPLVRIHSECLTGDVLGSQRCDCGAQLEMALRYIADLGRGILIYEQQEGRGIGLIAKLQAYELQDGGLDTVQANEKLGFKPDCREYKLPVAILQLMGIKHVVLMSNNPEKISALEHGGINVQRVSAEVVANPHSDRYLQTKREKMGHLLTGHAQLLPLEECAIPSTGGLRSRTLAIRSGLSVKPTEAEQILIQQRRRW